MEFTDKGPWIVASETGHKIDSVENMEHTDNDNKAAGAPSALNAGLGKDFERELRSMINPLYEDVRGTESYERKRLLGEIDRLRRIAVMVHDEILKGENDGVLLELLSMAWRVPNVIQAP